jgi:hypothetical protein
MEELGMQVYVTISKKYSIILKMPQKFGAFFLFINLIFETL